MSTAAQRKVMTVGSVCDVLGAEVVCGDDGVNWAVLFNSDADKDGKTFAGLIDPLLHPPANEIKDWPEIDLFRRNPVRFP